MENNLFESGAKTAGGNNLALSVLNDGSVYQDRLHCGFAMLQGSSHRLTFRDLANNEANKQRREFGCKFKTAEISDAASVIEKQTILHCLEIIRDDWNGGRIHFFGRKWRDNINGNTYFSARIVIPTDSGSRWLAVPFQYGYGDHWIFECRQTLKKMGFDFGDKVLLSDLPIDYTFEGVVLKREMYKGVYL